MLQQPTLIEVLANEWVCSQQVNIDDFAAFHNLTIAETKDLECTIYSTLYPEPDNYQDFPNEYNGMQYIF